MRTFERDRLIWDSPLDAREKFVLLAMALYINTKTGTCWPGLKRLASQTSLSEKSVRRAIKTLESIGAIEMTKRVSETGQWASNEYRIDLEKLATLPAVNLTSGQSDQRSICPSPAVNLSLTSGQIDQLTSLNELTDLNRSNKEGSEIFSDGNSGQNPPPVHPAQTAPPIDQTTDRNHPSSAPPLLPPKPDRPWRSGSGSNNWDEPFVEHILKYLKTLQGGENKTRVDALTWISNREHPAREGHEILRARWDECKSASSQPQRMTDDEYAVFLAKARARSAGQEWFIADRKAAGLTHLNALKAWDALSPAEITAIYRKHYTPPEKL
jgi:Helix-turn-helix domain